MEKALPYNGYFLQLSNFCGILRVYRNRRNLKSQNIPIPLQWWNRVRSDCSVTYTSIFRCLSGIIYEMNFTLCVLLVYNDNGSVQTLCITRVRAFCTKCLHRPIVIINQQYTKGEIHFIYLHYFHVFGFCFMDRYHGNGCVSLENPTVCTVNGRA